MVVHEPDSILTSKFLHAQQLQGGKSLYNDCFPLISAGDYRGLSYLDPVIFQNRQRRGQQLCVSIKVQKLLQQQAELPWEADAMCVANLHNLQANNSVALTLHSLACMLKDGHHNKRVRVHWCDEFCQLSLVTPGRNRSADRCGKHKR